MLLDLEKKILEDKIQKVVVGAVIIKDNKILFLRRVANDFMGGLVELPSGGTKEEETIIESLFREVKEETGLNILSVERCLGAFDYFSSSGKKARQITFLVSANGKIKINPDEHDKYYWLNPAENLYKELNISTEVRNIINKIALIKTLY